MPILIANLHQPIVKITQLIAQSFYFLFHSQPIINPTSSFQLTITVLQTRLDGHHIDILVVFLVVSVYRVRSFAEGGQFLLVG